MEICKDCGAPADPKNTMRAVDYDSVGPDLHFCNPCKERGDKLLEILFRGIQKGKVTVEQVQTEIAKHMPS